MRCRVISLILIGLTLYVPADAMTRAEGRKIVNELKRRHKMGEYGIRLVSDAAIEGDDRPDPERPYPIQLPNGREVYAIGLSGQRALFVNDLNQLARGGIIRSANVRLYNEFGFAYGEINGEPVRLIDDGGSSTWDLAFFYVVQENGARELWGAAGAMGNAADGQPLSVEDAGAVTTRQRKLFKFKFIPDSQTPFGYRLEGYAFRAPFNSVEPTPGKWLEERNGKVVFRHGYGGSPVFLANGDLYHDRQGRYPFVKDEVWVGHDGPDLTVITVTWMNQTFSEILEGPNVLLSPQRPDGSTYEGAERDGIGELLEGLHVTVLGDRGEPFSSMEALAQYRARGGVESFSGKLSGGAFDGDYGAFSAVGKNKLENLRLVVDDTDELYDLAEILAPLFVWRGRPVEFEIKAGDRLGLSRRQRMVALHGVARSAVHPEAFTDRPPQAEYVRDFKRQILTFPVERVRGPDGREYEIIKDNTGLIEILLRYATPKLRRLYGAAH